MRLIRVKIHILFNIYVNEITFETEKCMLDAREGSTRDPLYL